MLWMWTGLNKRPIDTLRNFSVGNNVLKIHSSFNIHPKDGGRVSVDPFICSENTVRCHKPEDHCMNTDSTFRSFF
jgi:hypothetical protein